ncbi:hypothetical protein JCM10207_007523 [Rhodosporidiobolus poonsookiae]
MSSPLAVAAKAFFVLLVAHSTLFGYFLLELQAYLSRFKQDRVGFKVLVYSLVVLEFAYYAVRFAGEYIVIDGLITGVSKPPPPVLNLGSVFLTSNVEAICEGFFVYRLCKVTSRRWMQAIACLLWAYSTAAHFAWFGIACQEGFASVVNTPSQLPAVQAAFWGTFIESSFVAPCLLYELRFANDRKMLNQDKSSSIAQLFSLALRTSSVLIVFELIAAVAVSIKSAPTVVLLLSIEYTATIWTVAAPIIILYTLSYRSVIRGAQPPSQGASSAGSSGPKRSASRTTRRSSLTDKLSEKLGGLATWVRRNSGSAGGAGGGTDRSRRKSSGGGIGGRGTTSFAGQISVSQVISEAEEVPLRELWREVSLHSTDADEVLGTVPWRGDEKPL